MKDRGYIVKVETLDLGTGEIGDVIRLSNGRIILLGYDSAGLYESLEAYEQGGEAIWLGGLYDSAPNE